MKKKRNFEREEDKEGEGKMEGKRDLKGLMGNIGQKRNDDHNVTYLGILKRLDHMLKN